MIGFFYAQSEYSISNNTISLEKLIEKTKEYNYSFLALSDNLMHSYYKAIRLCEKAKIKPIIGLEVEIDNNYLLLYAKNNDGLKNLFKISSEKETNELTFDFIKKHNSNIFMVTTGEKSKLELSIINNKLDVAFETYLLYKDVFNEFYIGLEKDVFPFDEFYNDIKNFAINNDIKYLPIHRTLFLDKADVDSYTVLKKINGVDIDKINVCENYLKNKSELENEFNDSDAFKYVIDVYNSVDIKLEKITNPLIKYPNDANISSIDYLTELCYLGLKKRLNGLVSKKYANRLEYELEIIKKMGYEDYFLIVFDFIKYAKKNNILVGPGRGSAAGSLVAYSIGITEVDPIKYDLFFERFLNPWRITMPDIDVDLPSDRRLEVIEYIKNKYGVNHVTFIVAFDSFKGKSAINDVSKVYNLEKIEIDELVKKCEVFDTNLGKYEVTKASIYSAYEIETNPIFKEVLLNSYKLFDLPKNVSTHAAGIILSNDIVTNNYPIMKSTNGYQSQIEAIDLEELGLLKMDLLSLKYLTILNNILERTNLNLKDIPLDDKKTFELLNNADTKNIFQLEGRGVSMVLNKYNVTSFMDLANLLALYRPGPMDQIDEYISRKKGKAFDYPSKTIEYILKPTYGIIVYQEQIMQIAHDYASYSLGEADVLRRAISKKKKEVLDLEREKFISKCSNKEEANLIYDYIVKFASYGFNKSHSVSYAYITYYLAYLKANYPLDFIISFLNDSISDKKTSLQYFSYLRSKNINIMNPNINKSGMEYTSIDNNLYLPLSLIESINKDSVNKIIEERKNGLFTSFTDFKKRVSLENNQYINLIYASCFDGCKKDMVDSVIYVSISIKTNVEYDYKDLIKYEEKALGFNLKYSIIKEYKEKDEYKDTVSLLDLNNTKATVLSHIRFIKDIKTKKNENMAFINLYDGEILLEVILFSNKYQEVINEINKDNRVKYDYDVFKITLNPVNRNNDITYEIIDIKKL